MSEIGSQTVSVVQENMLRTQKWCSSRHTTLVCFLRQKPHHMYSNKTQKRTDSTTEATQTKGLVPSYVLNYRKSYLLRTGTGLHGWKDDHVGRDQTGSGQLAPPFSTPRKVLILSRRVDPSALSFSLESHRHSSISLSFSFRFIDS